MNSRRQGVSAMRSSHPNNAMFLNENNGNSENVCQGNKGVLSVADSELKLEKRKALNSRRSVRGGSKVGNGLSRSPFNRSIAKRVSSPTSESSASTAASSASSTSPVQSRGRRSPTNQVLQQEKQAQQQHKLSPSLKKKHRRRRTEEKEPTETSKEEAELAVLAVEEDDEDASALLNSHRQDNDLKSSSSSSSSGARKGMFGLGSWRNTALLFIFEGLLLACAILFVSPSYEAPTSSTKPFFHTVSSGESFSFEIEVSAWPEPQFQWRLNGVEIPGATTRRLHVPQADMRHSGTYTCLLENMAGRLVWEEGYVNVVAASPAEKQAQAAATKAVLSSEDNRNAAAAVASAGDSETVRNARMCLLKRAPEPVLRSASVDGGAAVIAAGEIAGYLDCFEGLKQMLNSDNLNGAKRAERQLRALDILRSMHGSSQQRRTLVNAVSALNDLALAKLKNRPAQEVEDLAGALAFEAGSWCASTPQCQGKARSRVVHLIMHALDVEPLL